MHRPSACYKIKQTLFDPFNGSHHLFVAHIHFCASSSNSRRLKHHHHRWLYRGDLWHLSAATANSCTAHVSNINRNLFNKYFKLSTNRNFFKPSRKKNKCSAPTLSSLLRLRCSFWVRVSIRVRLVVFFRRLCGVPADCYHPLPLRQDCEEGLLPAAFVQVRQDDLEHCRRERRSDHRGSS